MNNSRHINGPIDEYSLAFEHDLPYSKRRGLQWKSYIPVDIQEILADFSSRDALLEMHKEKNGFSLPEIGALDATDIERYLKPQIEEAWKNRDIVAFQVMHLYCSGFKGEGTSQPSQPAGAEQEQAPQAAAASSTVVVTLPIEVTNAQWDNKVARRGELLKLSADVKNADDGTSGTMEIWEHDADGKHDFVKTLNTKVQGGKLEAEWEFEYIEDTDDIPTAEDSEKGYNPPEYFFKAKVGDAEAESGLVEFKDWIEIELVDDDDVPVPDVEYILHLPDGNQRKGILDSNGRAREKDIPPGAYYIEFVDLDVPDDEDFDMDNS